MKDSAHDDLLKQTKVLNITNTVLLNCQYVYLQKGKKKNRKKILVLVGSRKRNEL